MPLIEIEGVCHSYRVGGGLVWALDGITLAIEQGEFVAVTGPSGSGKSTFMNLLGCLDTPAAGQYRLDGIDIGSLGASGRAAIRSGKLGFVFQSFNLLPRTTALDNVELPLLYTGVPAAERRRRAMALLDQVGLADRIHHTPAELSGGEQQRIAIARALVNDPALLLADEPTGALDTHNSLEIMGAFQRLNRENGLTIVVVTHEADVAAYAGRVVTFRDGRIVGEDRRSLVNSGVSPPLRATAVTPRGTAAGLVSETASPKSGAPRPNPATDLAPLHRRIWSRRVVPGAIAASVLLAVGIGISNRPWFGRSDAPDLVVVPLRGEPPRQPRLTARGDHNYPSPRPSMRSRRPNPGITLEAEKEYVASPRGANRIDDTVRAAEAPASASGQNASEIANRQPRQPSVEDHDASGEPAVPETERQRRANTSTVSAAAPKLPNPTALGSSSYASAAPPREPRTTMPSQEEFLIQRGDQLLRTGTSRRHGCSSSGRPQPGARRRRQHWRGPTIRCFCCKCVHWVASNPIWRRHRNGIAARLALATDKEQSR